MHLSFSRPANFFIIQRNSCFCFASSKEEPGERAPPAITDNNHHRKEASCSNNGRQLARAPAREHLLICPALSKQKKKHFTGKKAAIRYLFWVGKPYTLALHRALCCRSKTAALQDLRGKLGQGMLQRCQASPSSEDMLHQAGCNPRLTTTFTSLVSAALLLGTARRGGMRSEL